MSCTLKGKVSWFNDAKGYGFISCPQLKTDVFAHYAEIVGEGFATLAEGQTVVFTVANGPKGNLIAKDIVKEISP